MCACGSQDPLVEAARIVSTQIRHAPKQLSSHTLAYDVAMKRAKYLLALQALLRGKRLRPSDPEVVYRITAFFHTMASDKTLSVHPTVAEVIRCVWDLQAPCLHEPATQAPWPLAL
jgi:peptide alpha-N-acetyltransferase